MDEIRHLLTRNRASRVVWCDANLVVPVTWDMGVQNFINLLRVFYIPEDKVRAGPNPNPIDVGAWRNFDIAWRFFAELRCSTMECAYLRA